MNEKKPSWKEQWLPFLAYIITIFFLFLVESLLLVRFVPNWEKKLPLFDYNTVLLWLQCAVVAAYVEWLVRKALTKRRPTAP